MNHNGNHALKVLGRLQKEMKFFQVSVSDKNLKNCQEFLSKKICLQGTCPVDLGDLPTESAVYCLHFVSPKNQKPLPAERYLGTDESGIIYIGSTDNLKRRMNGLRRSLTGSRGHCAGVRLQFMIKNAPGLLPKIADHYLHIGYILVKKGEEAKCECKLVKSYVETYADLPWLNHQFPSNCIPFPTTHPIPHNFSSE